MQVVMLLYPRLTQFDLTGPYDVLARLEELTLHLVWKNLSRVFAQDRRDDGPIFLQVPPDCAVRGRRRTTGLRYRSGSAARR
jgi:hypothetical protein